MGRRKTKKNKAGGGKHPSPGPQSSGSECSPAPVTTDPGLSTTVGASAAPSHVQVKTPPPQQRASPKRNLQKNIMTGTKAYQRAQIQGELSSLEAQLAAVEDLQARMAAKLSSVDNNMDVPPTAAPATTPAATMSPPVENSSPMPEDTAPGLAERVPKPKKGKKSKQDKALKQQENLKEAKEMKDAANVVQKVVQKEEPVEPQPKEECAIDNWEDIEHVEVVVESKDEKTTTEQAVTVNVGTLEESGVIKQSPSYEKTTEELQEGMCADGEVEKKIVADCHAEKDIGDMFGKALASEIAGYLMADYNRMLNLRTALDAQCQVAIVNTAAVVDEVTTPKTPKGGPYFSYADALKSSLPQTEETSDKQTHVHQYMKTEYDQCCLDKLEMAEGEELYHEAADTRPSKSPVPRIEVSLAGTPDVSSDDDGKPQKVSRKTDEECAIAEALMQDYRQMYAVSTCLDEEAKCRAVICACVSNKSSCCGLQKKVPCEDGPNDAAEIATFIRDDCHRIEAHHTALQKEDSSHVDVTSVDEARHTEAVRRAAVLEAATMEVEYEGAEEQFLIQRETRRSRPWKWVRADTAPAHIDVPETVHEPLSDAEEESDTRSSEVLTYMHGLVMECRDTYSQTDASVESPISRCLQDEMAQRMALQKYVHVLEQEVSDQRQKLSDQRKITYRLEDSISDKKAEASEAKMIAAEYKSRFTDMDGGMNYLAASQAQAKNQELEAKLQQSNNEVRSLTEKLSDRYQQVDLMPVIVHEQRMKKVEGLCHDLQVKVVQLEEQLAKLNNVRDVWGSASPHNPPPLQSGGGLDLGFPDLSPVPACLSSLGLSGSPPGESTTLTSGLLSGLSDLTSKSTPVVAPLAMQEEMDSDDDIDWTSASEYLRDSSDVPVTSAVAPPVGAPLPAAVPESCLPPAVSSLLGQMGCRSPPRAPRSPLCGGGGGCRVVPPPVVMPAHQQLHPIQQPQQGNQANGSSKQKGVKKGNRKSTK